MQQSSMTLQQPQEPQQNQPLTTNVPISENVPITTEALKISERTKEENGTTAAVAASSSNAETSNHYPKIKAPAFIKERAFGDKVVVASIHNEFNDFVNVHYSLKNPKIKKLVRFLSGNLPSNTSIGHHISNIFMSLSNFSGKVNSHGRKLAKDIEEMLLSFLNMLHTKNGDEQLQKLIREATLYEKSNVREIGSVGDHDEFATVTQPSDIFSNLMELIIFMIKNSSFREFILNYISILRSILIGRMDEREAERLYRTVEFGYKYGDPHSINQRILPNIPNRALEEDTMVLTLEQRFQRLLVHLSKSPEYNQYIYNIYSILDYIKTKIDLILSGELTKSNIHFGKMRDELISLLSNFTSIEALEQVWNEIWSLYNMVRNEHELKQYFVDMRIFILYCMENSDLLTNAYLEQKTTELIRRGHFLFDKCRIKYRELFDRIMLLVDNIILDILSDKYLVDLMRRLQKFIRDCLCDDIGRPDIFVMNSTFAQVKKLILPLITQILNHIPLPNIEGKSEDILFSLENMTLSGADILPDHIHIGLTNNMNLRTNIYEPVYSSYQLRIAFDNVRLKLNGAKFRITRIKFPKFEEHGVLDVSLEEQGLALALALSFSKVENGPDVIKLDFVDCSIDKLRVHVKEAKRKNLDRLILSLFSTYVKKKLSQSLIEQTKSTIELLTQRLNAFFKYQWETEKIKHDLNTLLKKFYFFIKKLGFDKIRRDLIAAYINDVMPTSNS